MLLDEAFFHAAGERPLDPKVMAYRQVLRLSRKMGIATLLASQKASDVLKDVRRWSTFHVAKLDPSRPDQTIVDMEGEIEGSASPSTSSSGGSRRRASRSARRPSAPSWST